MVARVLPASHLLQQGHGPVADDLRRVAGTGYWLHVDVDVLDPTVMPAVDSPDPGGIDAAQLTNLLAALAPSARGASVTVFDPDLDPDGSRARILTDVISDGLSALGADVTNERAQPRGAAHA
ncbi:MAG: arginase [Cellulosimicrobium sp.]|nr:arginase [Cellulosimicrobium sp.]